MKKTTLSLVLLILIFNLFFLLPLEASNLISIISPLAISTEDAEQIVEGKVEESFISRLKLSVEPFLPRKGEKPKTVIIEVKKGIFRENIILFPGLNIISISTLSGKHKQNKAIFLITHKHKKENQFQTPIEQWGTNSPIVFTTPQTLKTNKPRVFIKGVITKPEIKTIKIMAINTMDFLTSKPISSSREERIDYHEVKIKNLQFGFPVKLTEGLNIIIARPSLLSTETIDPTILQIKTLIYEKLSSQILLDEPQMQDGTLIIKGKVTDPAIKKVRINVSALVKEEIRPGIQSKTLINKKIKVNNKGEFALKLALEKKGLYIIKSPPTINVWANGNNATKTILKW
jgi:hypothetical protein